MGKSQRKEVLELLRMGTWTRKEIAQQLHISVNAVSVYIARLRRLGQLVIYDLKSKVLKTTDKTGHELWLIEKRLRNPRSKKRSLEKKLVKWLEISKSTPIRENYMEAEAQILLTELEIKRLDQNELQPLN